MYAGSHRYYIDGKAATTSVTTLVKQLFNPFKRDEFKNWGKDTDEFSDVSDKRIYKFSTFNRAALLGTLVHKAIEDFLNGTYEEIVNVSYSWIEEGASEKVRRKLKSVYPNEELVREIHQRFLTFMSYHDRYFKKFELIKSEYMVWGEMDGIIVPGTIDAIVWSDKSKREVHIIDWKTNKNLPGFLSKIITKGSPNFGKFKDTNDVYICQLHRYARLLEEFYDVKVASAEIVHLLNDRFTIFSCPLLPCNCVGKD